MKEVLREKNFSSGDKLEEDADVDLEELLGDLTSTQEEK